MRGEPISPASELLTWAVLLLAGSRTFIFKLDRGGIYFVIAVIGPSVLFYRGLSYIKSPNIKDHFGAAIVPRAGEASPAPLSRLE